MSQVCISQASLVWNKTIGKNIYLKNNMFSSVVMVHAFNPSTQKVECLCIQASPNYKVSYITIRDI